MVVFRSQKAGLSETGKEIERATMPVTTTIAKSFVGWMLIFMILCLVFGLWGLYDLTIDIPHRQQQHDRFVEVQQRLAALNEISTAREASGQPITDEEFAEYTSLEEEMQQLAPGGVNPVPPGKFDPLIQWIYILCLPCVPYFILQLTRTRGKIYRLDDDMTLHHPEGTWKAKDIVDIDMSRWMAKSIAWVVHVDGTRVKLDDYLYTNTHLIVGAFAHRKYPEKWDSEAKQIKTSPESEPDDEAGDDIEDDSEAMAGGNNEERQGEEEVK